MSMINLQVYSSDQFMAYRVWLILDGNRQAVQLCKYLHVDLPLSRNTSATLGIDGLLLCLYFEKGDSSVHLIAVLGEG